MSVSPELKTRVAAKLFVNTSTGQKNKKFGKGATRLDLIRISSAVWWSQDGALDLQQVLVSTDTDSGKKNTLIHSLDLTQRIDSM